MNIAVRYYSRGGNTKKIAEAIAEAVGTEAKTVSEPLSEDVDILFLGSAPYAFDVDDEVKKFISGINVSVGKVVNFSTSAAVKSTRKYIEKLLAEKISRLPKKNFPAGALLQCSTRADRTRATKRPPLNLHGKSYPKEKKVPWRIPLTH